MADAVIGSAYLQVIPKMDMKSLKTESGRAGKTSGKAFSKTFGGGLDGVGEVASKAFSVVAKAAGAAAVSAGAAVGVVGKQAFDAYASYEQLSGGITKLFGDADQAVFQHAQEAYRTAGMSANEYMTQVSGFAAALSNSLGGDTVRAAEQADVAMRAISDNVNTFGSDIDSVTVAFQGFARQNYTMLDNLKLGYSGTREGMEQLIADANEWGAANGQASDLSIDSFSDVITAIDQIQQKQRIAGTTAAEAGTTIEGSINAAKGAWTNLLTEFGKSDGNIKAAMDALVTTLVGDGSESNLGVFGNVIPRIGTIIGNVAQQLPTLIAGIAPQIAAALMTALDAATGGMASKVAKALSPVTDAISRAFGGISDWYAQNKSAIDNVVSSFTNFAGVLVDTLGAAIDAAAPVIGDFASAILPLLSAAFDFASGAIQGTMNLLGALSEAFAPVVDALSPVIEAIGTWFVEALEWAGEQMAAADFSGFASIVGGALGGIVDFIAMTVESITGFFSAVAAFIADPIGAIQGGFAALVGSGEAAEGGVSSSFADMDASVAASLSGVGHSIDTINNMDVESKDATAKVEGNAVTGKAEQSIKGTSRAIGGLSSRTVTAAANGNATQSYTADNVWDLVNAINNLTSKTVTITTNRVTTETKNAAGGIRYHADGMIVSRPTWIGANDIAGEAGAEAIIPLTNKRYVRPFAETVAEQMMARMGYNAGVTVNLNYGADANATEMARDIAATLEQIQRMGA